MRNAEVVAHVAERAEASAIRLEPLSLSVLKRILKEGELEPKLSARNQLVYVNVCGAK